MSERFTRIFTLPANLKTEDAPITIASGRLLYDNEKDRKVVVLKFKNVSDKEIQSVIVSIKPFNSKGAELDTKPQYTYTNLQAQSNTEFGNKKAIPVANRTACSFSVEVEAVLFDNGSSWVCPKGTKWSPASAINEVATEQKAVHKDSVSAPPAKAELKKESIPTEVRRSSSNYSHKSTSKRKKKNSGKIIAICVAIALVLGIGTYFGKDIYKDISEKLEADGQPEVEIVDAEQKEVIERYVIAWSIFSYENPFDSITYESIDVDDDGIFHTVKGTLTLLDGFDDSASKFSGKYSIVLTKLSKPNEETGLSYKVSDWEFIPTLDENIDYFNQFQQYIIDNGSYDAEDGAYLEEQVSSSQYRYIFAKDDTITYWDFTSTDSAIGEVIISYELTYKKDGNTNFKFQLKNGDIVSSTIPYSAAAQVIGCINPVTGEITNIEDETYVQCKKESIIERIKEWHTECVSHITNTMKSAGIVVSYEQIFGNTELAQ